MGIKLIEFTAPNGNTVLVCPEHVAGLRDTNPGEYGEAARAAILFDNGQSWAVQEPKEVCAKRLREG